MGFIKLALAVFVGQQLNLWFQVLSLYVARRSYYNRLRGKLGGLNNSLEAYLDKLDARDAGKPLVAVIDDVPKAKMN